MNKERESYYYTLGLQPGASPDEIRAAFRGLTKLYHPDHDSSLDAEMKYKEIRAAYDVLKRDTKTWFEAGAASNNYSHPSQPEKHENTTKGYGAAYGKEWSYAKDDLDDENSSFDFADLMWEHGDKPRLKKRLPFTLENLPRILQVSFNEIFGIGMVFRVVFAVWGLWSTFSLANWSAVWKVGVILCILPVTLLFRYYFPCYRGRFMAANATGTLLSSTVLSLVCIITTNQMNIAHVRGNLAMFVFLTGVIFMCVFLLWGPPLIVFVVVFSYFLLVLRVSY